MVIKHENLVLTRRLNYKVIELRSTTHGQTIGVLQRNGDYLYLSWLGFIDREKARCVGTPVRLKVSRIGLMNEWDTQWSEVPTGKHVQGCLTSDGVYAVLTPSVRVI